MLTILGIRKVKTCDALVPVYGRKDFVNRRLENQVQLKDGPVTTQQIFLLQKYQNLHVLFSFIRSDQNVLWIYMMYRLEWKRLSSITYLFGPSVILLNGKNTFSEGEWWKCYQKDMYYKTCQIRTSLKSIWNIVLYLHLSFHLWPGDTVPKNWDLFLLLL